MHFCWDILSLMGAPDIPKGRSSRRLSSKFGAGGQRQTEPQATRAWSSPDTWDGGPGQGGRHGRSPVSAGSGRGKPPGPGRNGNPPLEWTGKCLAEATGTVSWEETGTEGWQLPGGGRGFQVGG